MNRALPWIVALIISLMANGVMTGLVLHQVVGRPHITDMLHPDRASPPPRGGRMGRDGGFNIRAFVRNLPEAQREMARDRFDAERDAIRTLMFEVQDAQRAAEEAMMATPYDPDAVAEALNDLREKRFEIEAGFEAIVLDLIADLPAEQRMQAMRAGRRGPPRRGPGDERHERRGPPPDRF